MQGRQTLATCLEAWQGTDTGRQAVARAVQAIAAATATLSAIIARGELAGATAAVVGENTDGDSQKALDVQADELLQDELKLAGVAIYASEELEQPLVLDASGARSDVVVVADPLDGSSNIDTNVSVGTIFSILPRNPDGKAAGLDDVLQPGRRQLAAGFVIYGPHTAMVLTLGEGTQVFVLDREIAGYVLARPRVAIPPQKNEYAINASNYRYWEEPVRTFIDDCLEGEYGPHGNNFNMRWIASLVAEAFRILTRGGVFLYPRDSRAGYQSGRLRLCYEANPIAFVIEQAGGRATEGMYDILDLVPKTLHQRVPLIFGSAGKVMRISAYHESPLLVGDRSPLFKIRSLFRR